MSCLAGAHSFVGHFTIRETHRWPERDRKLNDWPYIDQAHPYARDFSRPSTYKEEWRLVLDDLGRLRDAQN